MMRFTMVPMTAVAIWKHARKTGLRCRSARDRRNSARSDAGISVKATIWCQDCGALLAPAMLMTIAEATQAAAGQSRMNRARSPGVCVTTARGAAMGFTRQGCRPAVHHAFAGRRSNQTVACATLCNLLHFEEAVHPIHRVRIPGPERQH